MFYSIQGEGVGLGKPSIFIRFWGCNLRCCFNGEQCDTPYSVTGNEYKEMTIEETIKKVKFFDCNHIVFTGGEPTLYQNFIVELMKKLKYYTSEVETNGTIPLIKNFANIINIFNLSVKLESSNQSNKKYDKLRINPIAIDTFPQDKSYFKFVVSADDDIKEILKLNTLYSNIPVLLMPEGITRDEIIEHSPAVVELCMKYNFIFCPREHIIIWNNKRGV